MGLKNSSGLLPPGGWREHGAGGVATVLRGGWLLGRASVPKATVSTRGYMPGGLECAETCGACS